MNNREQINEFSNLSSDQEEVLRNVEIPDTVNVHIQNAFNSSSNENDIRDMNNRFKLSQKIYEDVLAPQLEENEKLKRDQKKTLIKKLFNLLFFQFIVTYIFVLMLILSIIFSGKLDLSEKIILNLIKFTEFYITSIVVELISILFFIVKNVFDTSIVELLKGFDKRNEKGNNN